MKASAYIILLSMLVLAACPLVSQFHMPMEQTSSCGASCCDDVVNACCCDEGAEEKEEKGPCCEDECHCACQFHINAVNFHFENTQVAEEQEFHYGEYRNAYSFEYFSLHLPPPRLG